MPSIDDILTEPAARRISIARNVDTSLAAAGWRTAQAAVHSGGTADVAADRVWSRGKLTARVRLVIRCDSRATRLVLSSMDAPPSGERLPSYSFGDDDRLQRRSITESLGGALTDRLH